MSYDKERYATDPEYRRKFKALRKAWKQANKSKISARRRHRLATDPEFAEARRGDWLRQTYGLSLESFNAMVARQKGACAICRKKRRQRLCVDHSHDYDLLRFLLCRKCNTGLGCFDDDPALLRAAADYLELWQRLHAALAQSSLKPIRKRVSKRRKKGKS
jgi:hypothetical protein